MKSRFCAIRLFWGHWQGLAPKYHDLMKIADCIHIRWLWFYLTLEWRRIAAVDASQGEK